MLIYIDGDQSTPNYQYWDYLNAADTPRHCLVNQAACSSASDCSTNCPPVLQTTYETTNPNCYEWSSITECSKCKTGYGLATNFLTCTLCTATDAVSCDYDENG